MAAQVEPGHECLIVDHDGDVWSWNAHEWICLSQAGAGQWADLAAFGPFLVFAPKTDDGAVVPEGGFPAPSAGSPTTAPSSPPRAFELYRHIDKSGVSGTGVVAWGVQFPDGAAAVRWRGDHPSTAAWDGIAGVLAVHGHAGATELRWLDEPQQRGDHCDNDD